MKVKVKPQTATKPTTAMPVGGKPPEPPVIVPLAEYMVQTGHSTIPEDTLNTVAT